jgi:hypothetical protein
LSARVSNARNGRSVSKKHERCRTSIVLEMHTRESWLLAKPLSEIEETARQSPSAATTFRRKSCPFGHFLSVKQKGVEE